MAEGREPASAGFRHIGETGFEPATGRPPSRRTRSDWRSLPVRFTGARTGLETEPGIAFSHISPMRFRSRSLEAVEQQLADDRVVGDLRGPKAEEALGRKSDEQAAPVVGVGDPLDEPDLREPVHGPRDAARAEVASLAQLPDRERAVGRGDERDQDSVGVEAEAVLGQQRTVQLSRNAGVHPQHAAPGAELGRRERVWLGRPGKVERSPRAFSQNYLTSANTLHIVCVSQILYRPRANDHKGDPPCRAASLSTRVLAADEGTRLQSGPGRDLVFKVTGEDTGGAFDYFTVEVAPKGGPPLHVHHKQEETIHVLKGALQGQDRRGDLPSWTRAALPTCRPRFRTPS